MIPAAVGALARLNKLPPEKARAEFLRCCGSARWAEAMLQRRPYRSPAQLFGAARTAWESLHREDWLEAFGQHPRIGDLASLRTRFASTSEWASGEQGAVAQASEQILVQLSDGNRRYEQKFGYIFIVCATGKSAAEMLSMLEFRLPNSPAVEIRIAATEQAKITRLRLEKLLSRS